MKTCWPKFRRFGKVKLDLIMSSRIVLGIIILFLSFELALAQSNLREALSAPLFEDAVNYEDIELIPACQEAGRRIIYHECRNSRRIYDLAVKNAAARKQPLMVIFGFNTCPACLNLEQSVFMLDPAPRNSDIIKYLPISFVKSFKNEPMPLNISVVRIHSRSEHGLKLADELGVTKLAKERGWHRVWSPFILFVNPNTQEMNSESYWEPTEVYCDWFAEFAASVQKIGMASSGEPYVPRKRCKI